MPHKSIQSDYKVMIPGGKQCYLCPSSRVYGNVQKHFKRVHLSRGVRHAGKLSLFCKGCPRESVGHYHCPWCEGTRSQRCRFLKHVAQCRIGLSFLLDPGMELGVGTIKAQSSSVEQEHDYHVREHSSTEAETGNDLEDKTALNNSKYQFDWISLFCKDPKCGNYQKGHYHCPWCSLPYPHRSRVVLHIPKCRHRPLGDAVPRNIVEENVQTEEQKQATEGIREQALMTHSVSVLDVALPAEFYQESFSTDIPSRYGSTSQSGEHMTPSTAHHSHQQHIKEEATQCAEIGNHTSVAPFQPEGPEVVIDYAARDKEAELQQSVLGITNAATRGEPSTTHSPSVPKGIRVAGTIAPTGVRVAGGRKRPAQRRAVSLTPSTKKRAPDGLSAMNKREHEARMRIYELQAMLYERQIRSEELRYKQLQWELTNGHTSKPR